MKKNATPIQFRTLITRMMPRTFSSMGEGQLIAQILTQAWADAADYKTARDFFLDEKSALEFYCEKVGLNAQQIREVFTDNNRAYKLHLLELSA